MAASQSQHHRPHYGSGPGQFASSQSSGSLAGASSSPPPLAGVRQQQQHSSAPRYDGPAYGAQYNQQHYPSPEVDYYATEKRASYPEDTLPSNAVYDQTNAHHSYPGTSSAANQPGRMNSIDSLNFAQMSINDRQHGAPTPAQAIIADYERSHSSYDQAGRPYPQRGVSMHSNASAPTDSRPLSYDQQRGYPEQYDQAQFASTSQNQYDQSTSYDDGYGGQVQDYYNQPAQGQHPYPDPNASYYDPATGQYYPYNGTSQGFESAGPSQQPYYAQTPQPQHGSKHFSDPYGHGFTMSSHGPGFDPYAGAEPHRAVSGTSSMSHGSQAYVPPLNRNRTTASGKTSVSATSADRDKPPITKAAVDEYRNRIKSDPDPETQFNFARFLIEAARRLAVAEKQGSVGHGDDVKSVKKYRDALLQEALKLIKRLATQGSGLGKPAYADAQFFLANCLGHGALGLAIDHEKAYNLYVQASKQNHPAATYRTAVCNEVGAGTRRDPARAVLFYRKASALGDTAGMYKLGMILLNGLLAQPKNPREAVTWLKKAAVQADEENPHALYELGVLYEKQQEFMSNGQPVPHPVVRDESQAREFFTQAAQLGYPPSQYKLGSCYEYGNLTCPVDPRRSIAWYTRAAEKGHAESELALSGWYLTGSPEVLKQSDSEAYLWARRGANKGLSKAEYAVGYYSEMGIGVKADLDEAKMWYLRAAASGNRRAMQRLSELKKLGNKKAGNHSRPTRQQAQSECIIS